MKPIQSSLVLGAGQKENIERKFLSFTQIFCLCRLKCKGNLPCSKQGVQEWHPYGKGTVQKTGQLCKRKINKSQTTTRKYLFVGTLFYSISERPFDPCYIFRSQAFKSKVLSMFGGGNTAERKHQRPAPLHGQETQNLSGFCCFRASKSDTNFYFQPFLLLGFLANCLLVSWVPWVFLSCVSAWKL